MFNVDQLIDYQKDNKKKGYKVIEKLMLMIRNKEKYAIDGEMLDWYLDHGVRLEDTTTKNELQYKVRFVDLRV